MRIGFVVPWVHGIRGSQTVLAYANELGRGGHDVVLFAHTVHPSTRPELVHRLGSAHLEHLVESNRPYEGHTEEIRWQLGRGREGALARLVAASNARSPFDAIVLVANEGHRLGGRLRTLLPRPGPLLGWSVMELIDHSFLLRYERDLPAVRALSAPIYPWIHSRWAASLAGYDFLMANSEWTAEILQYLYGVEARHVFLALPPSAFEAPPPVGLPVSGPFLALPTASLGRKEQDLVSPAIDRGIPLVAYGPRPVRGVAHMGFLPEAEMRAVLRAASATVFLFDYEALGLIPFESLALGTPVITQPKHGVLRQWANHSGVRFVRSSEELVAEAQRWLEHAPTPEERRRSAASVEPFRAPSAVARFLAFLDGARVRRRANR